MQEVIENIKEKVKDFIENNTKLTVTLVSIFIFLCVSGTLVSIFHRGSNSKTKAKINLPKENFTLRGDFFTPSEVSLTDDYYFSRQTEEKWSETEIDRWFTTPNEESLKKLGEANDGIAKKITEAAP